MSSAINHKIRSHRSHIMEARSLNRISITTNAKAPSVAARIKAGIKDFLARIRGRKERQAPKGVSHAE